MNFQYASGRGNINEHSLALKEIVDQLGEEVTEINFVAHSLGNLVVRHYLHNTRDEATGQEGDPRIARMVMIGPPNQGSRMARIAKHTFFFNMATGASGAELSSRWDQLEPKLSTPQFQFGIIAGGQSDDKTITNVLLKGKDDFTVSVEETKLPGAHDFVVRPMMHGVMMKAPDTLEFTARFLQLGHFVSEDKRSPLKNAIDAVDEQGTVRD